ncbi:MAG: hypothetical protein E7548_04780 [Ruminococcaceae bacterium]|nr:hypothetical protein [Oscillospiraceae bacterium]
MNFKKAVIFLGCAAPVCALLNCLVMFFTIETSSGFFRTGYSSLAVLMLGIIAALIILSAVAFSRIRRLNPPAFWPYISAILSVVLGICFLAEAFKFTPLVGTTPAFAVFIRIFAVLSGIVFVWRGVNGLFFVPIYKEIYILPVIYMILKVVSTFIAYAGVATITETVFELFAICAMLIFTLNFAKAENGIKNKKGVGLSTPLCVVCALVILTQIAPYAVNYFAKKEALIHANSLFSPTSIILSLFIISVALFKNQKELD